PAARGSREDGGDLAARLSRGCAERPVAGGRRLLGTGRPSGRGRCGRGTIRPALPRSGVKTPLKLHKAAVDSLPVDAAERDAILTRYREHTARFDSVAARREPAVA